MENRYLFRGKRIDNNEWEYGYRVMMKMARLKKLRYE